MELNYGEALPDQVDRIVSLSDAQLGLLNDIREIYKERATLEKEYSTKMFILARRALDRRNKRMVSLVAGNDPVKPPGEEALRRSTLDNAYMQLITSLESSAQDHSTLSEQLNTQISDAMKNLERRHEEMKTKQLQLYQKSLADRDRIYSDRLKAKQKYDEECLEIDTYRRKQDKLQDDKHASRAQKQYESQVIDMQNNKNTFIIATTVANKIKNRFYTTDLPIIENNFQRLQSNLIYSLISVLLRAQSLQTTHLTTLQDRVNVAQQALSRVSPLSDQELFVAQNSRPFSIPSDWGWEPCTGYYDTGEMVVEPAPKVFLQNKLSRSRGKLEEIDEQMSSKKREVDKLFSIVDAYTKDRNLGDVDDVTNNYHDAQAQLTPLEVTVSVLSAEVEVISTSLKGDEGSRNPHNFKSTSFSIPTTCGYCKSSIWGLSKQGKTCRTCGLSVHAKCELKVPADCGGTSNIGSSASDVNLAVGANLSRVDSHASSFTTTSTQTSSSALAAIPQIPNPQSPSEGYLSARVLYDFEQTSPLELTVTEGTRVRILEDDDGSGWVKVADANAHEGLVPASYIELTDDDNEDPQVRDQETRVLDRSGSGKHVRGLYTYQARGEEELDVVEGELIELSSGPEGGQNYADGWWEGYDSTGKKGIFPSNYVELA